MLSFKKGKTKQNLHNSESKGASKLINTKLCNAKIKETPNTYMETLTWLNEQSAENMDIFFKTSEAICYSY